MMLSFTVFGVPAGQGSMRIAPSRSTGRMIADHPKKTVQWRNVVAARAVEELGQVEGEYELMQGALALIARFYFPRPKSAPRRRLRPEVKPDLDKLVRALGDALEGVVYRNDSQIVQLRASKHYGEPARVEIAVMELPGVVEKARGEA
jgi:Holliday junction resolvase RusA-like endonuclease